MPKQLRMDTLNKIIDTGLVPVFYNPDVDTSMQIIQACFKGGAKVVEFTNRGERAYSVFSTAAERLKANSPQITLGVGSIIDPYSASLFINAGADFIVGPTFNQEVARICNRLKVPYCPGCGTASEISAAEEAGVEIVKLFPGDLVGGPDFVKAVLGPMPWVRFMPTGGVDATAISIKNWFNAGVTAVGIGSNLIRKDWIKQEEFNNISELTANILTWIRQARAQSNYLGFEHVCLYPPDSQTADAMSQWYQDVFNLGISEEKTAYFLEGKQGSRLEISRVEHNLAAHIAINVANFEEAYQDLVNKGFQLEEPLISPAVKLAFLKETDPAGHRVHIVWRK
ncbi:MAG: bifunctional 4-hydroxy-2-oxoglutarate aldolase/2-dehydro-3-deoxy-phosphogluconate aldolase [Candidatus Cloacimonetes bacterium]|nr:bifunctional 4-hydroxy-2-oxoglutarate aldolase/2-dehydro-3-deoxy-phosphogluconate aldolase [Candidatus Cloacimonadota bacterium]